MPALDHAGQEQRHCVTPFVGIRPQRKALGQHGAGAPARVLFK